MVLIELVYCRITGKTRALPKIHHFIPLEPWSCKKIKGKKKVMPFDNRNDGSSSKWEKKEQIKLVLDMSNDGPMFKMLESMLGGGMKNGEKGAYDALNRLLRSGIPGLENLFGKGADGQLQFNKMSDDDKRRFIAAVTGAGGKIDSKAAAALIAAAASGGDPEIANKIIEKMMSGLGDEIDPAMMSALMATTALVAAGASNEEILAAMQRELAASGLSPDEILAKTLLLQKAMAGDNSPAFINKTIKNALNVANITPEELTKCIFVEKAIASSEASPEDIAKSLLIQIALKSKGAKTEDIVKALQNILNKSEDKENIKKLIEASLNNDGMSMEDVNKILSVQKALDGGKIRGLKEVQRLIEEGNVDSAEGIEEMLRKALDSGALSTDAIVKTLILQKALLASGTTPEMLATSMLLQKAMSDTGIPVHEVANAMSLAMTLGGNADDSLKIMKNAFHKGASEPLTVEDIEAVLALKKALDEGEIPKEAINLMRKALKQRKGSVDNVAETLIASLAASGQSQEAIAKAMVKALQATGATPEEIAKTMQHAMEKTGASQEEIARAMAAAMVAAGSSAEDIASALKETFAKAMADDPSMAADIARSMAEALAAAGASAEDIAKTMQETLMASISADGNASAEDILEIAQTVARSMAQAGASASEIAAAMKVALGESGASNDPEVIAELAKTMAKAMAEAGATGEEIARAMHDALKASGASEEEIANNLLKAIASSGASAEDIAKTMQAAMEQSGMSQEEIQRHVLEAMVEAGASAEDIAKTVVQQNLMAAMGKSSSDLAKEFLTALRSGEDMDLNKIHALLLKGGIGADAAMKVLMFQKALAACGSDPEDVAKAIMLQKAWLNGYENSPSSIAKCLEDIIADSEICQSDIIEQILANLASDDMSVDDIIKALQLDKALQSGGTSVEQIKGLMKKLIGDDKCEKADVCKAIEQILSNKGANALDIARTAILQKLISALGVSSDDIAKMMQLQKSMYDAGASPQDISMLMEMALGGGKTKPANLINMLRLRLNEKLAAEDILNITEVAEAFEGSNIPQELITKVILMQKAIESEISSPEKSSEGLANKMKQPGANPVTLVSDLMALLKSNGVTLDHLQKSVLLQKATGACGISLKELSLILELQNAMLAAGRSSADIALAFREIITKSALDPKVIAQSILSAMDQLRLRDEDVLASSHIFEAILEAVAADVASDGAELILKQMHGTPSQNDMINILRKALEANNIKPESIIKAVLLQKLLAAADCDPEDLAKVLRIQNALVGSGAPPGIVAKSIMEALEKNKNNKNIIVTMKKPILDVFTLGTININAREIDTSQAYQKAMTTNDQSEDKMQEIFENAMKLAGLSKEDMAKALLVQKILSVSGISPEIMAQAVMLEKALTASGATPEEIAQILAKATSGLSEEAINELMRSVLQKKGCSKEEIENMIKLQKSLRAGALTLGDNRLQGSLQDLLSSGQFDANLLGKALLMQKIFGASGLSPDDLGKAILLQNAMIEAGTSPEKVANCMNRTLLNSGMSLEHLITLMEIELKAALCLKPRDIIKTLQFEKMLGAGSAAKRLLRRMNPEAIRLMEATVKVRGKPGETNDDLLDCMKEALGDLIDTETMQAMEVAAAMSNAGASKEEIEEMMQMIMNKGGGISEEFILSIKEAMKEGGSPKEKLEALKAAMEEEMNSVTNALRNTFINKIPTQEEIDKACNCLAEKLGGGDVSRTDVKLALVDVLDEALQDVIEYEPDAAMIFNYLMVAAIASAADIIERNGLKPTGSDLQEIARKEMLEMIERLLMEAELLDELSKLDVYGKTIDGIKQMLNYLLKDPKSGKALKRQVAFLFDFEEIEHTTILGLTLQDIIKDAKHKLRPWELEKKRKIRGLKKSKVPNLGYSQVYCYYRVLPEHLEGPPIGFNYE